MTLKTRFDQLQTDVIANITAITNRPDGWLPHTVFVKEEGEDRSGAGTPVYKNISLLISSQMVVVLFKIRKPARTKQIIISQKSISIG